MLKICKKCNTIHDYFFCPECGSLLKRILTKEEREKYIENVDLVELLEEVI